MSRLHWQEHSKYRIIWCMFKGNVHTVGYHMPDRNSVNECRLAVFTRDHFITQVFERSTYLDLSVGLSLVVLSYSRAPERNKKS